MSFQLRLGRWEDQLADVHECDALITDTPYSPKTHDGHNAGRSGDGYRRTLIDYTAWQSADVFRFVDSWAPRTRGWFVSITDSELAPYWVAALRAHDRYVFAPLQFIRPGASVRRQGDGPALWSVNIVVARPRCAPWSRWGALPGGYVLPAGLPEWLRRPVMIGGKPLWLMRELVRDYSRPGDLVVDPCAGAATTLIAAEQLGRRALGAEQSPLAFTRAREHWTKLQGVDTCTKQAKR